MSEKPFSDGIVGSEHLGARVFCISAPDAQTLADRLALVLGEHMACDDEMHLTYSAIQSGRQHDAGRDGWRCRPDRTELFFECSALVVLRSPTIND